uniref:cytidine deaminase n=1 Tax=Kalanchoe fedtschenkoi TaxID=63787 RepID=A0A7N0UU29_KALFE
MDQPQPQAFVIGSSQARSLAADSNLTLLQLLPTLVKPAQALARPPISNFHVGAVGLGSSGRVFIGVNLEFPGLPLHHSVHAEQFLITNLAIHSEPALQALAVSAAPCGHCRQFLQEIRNAPDLQILITDEDRIFKSLSTLLPDRFGPFDLLDTARVPLLLEPNHNRLKLPTGNGGDRQNLILEALDAANRSHAPYSKCPSGVALVDDEGRVYKGSYKESAAYNPSLGPVQAAVIAYVAGGGGGYERIVGGVLVEMEGAQVKQEATARMILHLISPQCEFLVVHCSKQFVN